MSLDGRVTQKSCGALFPLRKLLTLYFHCVNCLLFPGFLQSGALFFPGNAIIPFKAYKLDLDKKLFDFYAASIAFRITLLMNLTSF